MATPQVSVYALYPRLCDSAFPLVMFPAGPHALSSWLCLQYVCMEESLAPTPSLPSSFFTAHHNWMVGRL